MTVKKFCEYLSDYEEWFNWKKPSIWIVAFDTENEKRHKLFEGDTEDEGFKKYLDKEVLDFKLDDAVCVIEVPLKPEWGWVSEDSECP